MGQDKVAAIGPRHGANICSTFFVMQCVQKSEGCRRSLLYMAPLCLAIAFSKRLELLYRRKLSTVAYFARIYIPPLFKIAVFGSPAYAYITLIFFHVLFYFSSRSFQRYAMEYYIIFQHPPLLRAVSPLVGPLLMVCTSVLKSL